MNTSTGRNEPLDARVNPVAYVSMHDHDRRARIVNVLERAGWTVIVQPTGFHLLQAIAGVIEGHTGWLRPGLIVIDARARGCAGTTIAIGLRELGIAIPIVLIAAPGEAALVSPDRTLRIVEAAAAEAEVTALAGMASDLARASPPAAAPVPLEALQRPPGFQSVRGATHATPAGA